MEIARGERLPDPFEIRHLSTNADTAIKEGNVEYYARVMKELSKLRNSTSWTPASLDETIKLCEELGFLGVWKTTTENASHLWWHEEAHNNEAKRLGIASVFRISEVEDVHHSRFHAYADISIDDLMSVTGERPSLVLKYVGLICLAPEKAGWGYKRETDLAKEYLKLSKTFAIKEKFGWKYKNPFL